LLPNDGEHLTDEATPLVKLCDDNGRVSTFEEAGPDTGYPNVSTVVFDEAHAA
jgi:hypothetical protein